MILRSIPVLAPFFDVGILCSTVFTLSLDDLLAFASVDPLESCMLLFLGGGIFWTG